MKRVSLVLLLAVLIMTCGLFAQKNVTFAQPTAAGQGNIMIADNVEIQKTTTTKEKRKHHHRKQHHEQRKTTTTTERPSSEESRTTTTTESR